MPVLAGDSVSVSITLSGGQWYIDMNDITNGQSWSTTVDYSGPDTLRRVDHRGDDQFIVAAAFAPRRRTRQP